MKRLKMTKDGATAPVTRSAFEKVWKDKGWTLVGNESAPEPEPEPVVQNDTVELNWESATEE